MGKNVLIHYESKYTFGDLVASKYILSNYEEDIPDNIKDVMNDYIKDVKKDEVIYLYISKFYSLFEGYVFNKFGIIQRYPVNSDYPTELMMRKQQVSISNVKFYINCLKTEERAKENLKILFDEEDDSRKILFPNNLRKILPPISYLKKENNSEVLYKEIIVDEHIVPTYSPYINESAYVIISPFKENCDDLIKSYDYKTDKVIEYLKKEHNFNELVEWVSKNAICKVDAEDHKNKVIENYTKLIEDYLELLKKEQEQKICLKEIVEDESKLRLDKVEVSKEDL